MLNVPQGFKLGAERFKATLDLAADAAAKAFRGPILDPRAFPGPGDGASLPITLAREAAQVTLNIAPGAIVVQQQPGEDGKALANRVLGQLRIRARAQTGDTLDFGRLV